MGITLHKEGRRFYIQGLPYDLRQLAKNEGCKWDPARRMWWSGREEVARSVMERAIARLSEKRERGDTVDPSEKAIFGIAYYKGRKYPVLWHGTTRSGEYRAKLAFWDGSKVFWTKEPFELAASWSTPKSLEDLRGSGPRRKSKYPASVPASHGRSYRRAPRCGCTDPYCDCYTGRCRCGPECVCRGGAIYDC